MTDVIKKTPDTNGIYQYVIAANIANYPVIDWEHDPDTSVVDAISRNYWKYDGTNVLVEMIQAEKDVVDTAIITVELVDDPDLPSIHAPTETFAALETKIITVPYPMENSIMHVINPAVSELVNEVLLSAAGSGPVGWDPNNVATNEASINNGSVTDLVYNNSAAGNTPGIIMGIDMGTPTAITAMKRWDYSTTYFDTQWEFIGTDDATAVTYTVIFSETQTSPNLDPDPFSKAFGEVTFRYYGWRCVTSNSATYTITREMELYHGTLQTVEKEMIRDIDFKVVKASPTEFSVTNLKSEAVTYKIMIMGM